MGSKPHPKAGQLLAPEQLIDVPGLISNYYAYQPDIVKFPEQKVSFGTSGHRGCALDTCFNHTHIVAITQAIVDLRIARGLIGPTMVGKDTHALSEPAFSSVLSVLIANGVAVIYEQDLGVTPTPVISHRVIEYNRDNPTMLADGIVITPSHNPPQDGGLKYNDTHGGPANTHLTRQIATLANQYISDNLLGVKQVDFSTALADELATACHYASDYVAQLNDVLDMQAIKDAEINIAVDPVGGAGRLYWPLINRFYGLDIKVLNDQQSSDFSFVPRDKDGVVRMDCSSPYCVQDLISRKDEFDIGIANDPDNDRHGIVSKDGLLNANHYMAVAVAYLLAHRKLWPTQMAVGRSLMATSLIDKVTLSAGRKVYEVPVGFKWFVDGLTQGKLAFAGEDSAGASFVRHDGSVFTTDKDGFIMGLLAAEILAVTGFTPCEYYQQLADKHGHAIYKRFDAPATPDQKAQLKKLKKENIDAKLRIAGEPIEAIYTHAPGDGSAIGGVKVVMQSGWFAARPSGTEPLYKIYVESFKDEAHVVELHRQAKLIVDGCLCDD